MNQSQLFPMVRQKVKKSLNGYVDHRTILRDIDTYILRKDLIGVNF
jgi:hypothetical protein